MSEWLNKKNGKLVYTPSGTYWNEINRNGKMKEYILREKRGKRKIKEISKQEFEDAMRELKGITIKSNDKHILALAKAAHVKLLVSRDRNLHEDFGSIIKGKIYQKKEHAHLLTPDTCP